jgi:flagellar FliL protein
VAEQQPEAVTGGPAARGKKPILLIVLVIINMAVVAGVGVMVHLGQKKKEKEPHIDDVIKGEKEAQLEDIRKANEEFIGALVPLETFLVNLADSRGSKIAKVNMELEVEGEKVEQEIEKRKPQIRDIIIFLLSSKNREQVSSRAGKDQLKGEIRDTVNSFLTKGKIKRVYFTEFILN